MSWMRLKMTTEAYEKCIYKIGCGVERVVAVWTPLPQRPEDQILWKGDGDC